MNARHVIDEALDPKRVLHSIRREPEITVGEEILRATGDTVQIVQATLDKLAELNRKDYEAELTDEVQDYLNGNLPPDFDPEFYLYERLFPHMGLYCPPFTYFGNYEADGSIGCWPYDSLSLEEFVDKGVLVVQEADQPDWADPELANVKFMILDRPSGGKECWSIRRGNKPFLIWRW